MSLRVVDLCVDARDPARLAHFWAAALRWTVGDDSGDAVLVTPTDGTSFGLEFVRVADPKLGKNRLHLDIAPNADSTQGEEVARLIKLGASVIDVGQGNVGWVVMADPDGNEFCVLGPKPNP